MKQLEKQVQKNIIYWEAVDGTQFDSKDECIEYEKTAKCYIYTAFNKLINKSISEDDLNVLNDLTVDNPDYELYVVKPKSQEDVRIICQRLALNGNINYDKIFKAFEENKTLCIINNNDGYIWVHCIIEDTIDILNSIINNG